MKPVSRKLLASLMVALLLALALAGCAEAPPRSEVGVVYGANVDSNEIGQIIADLTGADYAGRLAGTEGNERAAKYIAEYFRKAGLASPPGLDDYRQPYEQRQRADRVAPQLSLVDVQGKLLEDFAYLKDFSCEMGWPGLRMKADLTADAVVLSNLASPPAGSLAGKIALVPATALGGSSGEALARKLLTAIRAAGMAGAIVERPLQQYYGVPYFPVGRSLLAAAPDPAGDLVFYASSATYAAITGEVAKGNRVRMAVDSELADLKATNVIAFIPGTDESLKESPVLISAHFDGVGTNADGTYNPGGMDDASGTAAVMVIAKAVMAAGAAPTRPIIFAAFNGEEEGYCGSTAYVAHPILPLQSTVMLNLDMVGTEQDKPLEILVQSGDSDNVALRKQLCDYALIIGLDAEGGVAIAGYDYVPLAAKGVRAVTLAEDDFDNYHSAGDTAANTDPKRIERVVQLILYYLDRTAFSDNAR